jgi:MFS family permease
MLNVPDAGTSFFRIWPALKPSSPSHHRIGNWSWPARLPFFATGILTTLLGPMLPILIARWAMNDTQAGNLFLVQFLASLMGVQLSGVLLVRWGFRPAFLSGCCGWRSEWRPSISDRFGWGWPQWPRTVWDCPADDRQQGSRQGHGDVLAYDGRVGAIAVACVISSAITALPLCGRRKSG